jgi:hypothetical protein
VSFELDRYEFKSVITSAQRDGLLNELLPCLQMDANTSPGGFYPIVTLYYDSPVRDCYWEKIRRQGSRRKLRVRVYGSLDQSLAPTCFVEIKHKCDGRGVKRRLRVSLEDALKVTSGQPIEGPFSLADQRLVEEVHHLVQHRNFQPCCCMRYDRQAFDDKASGSDLRITFDTGIAYRMNNLTPVPDDRGFEHYLLPKGWAVMEVKATGSVPFWLPRVMGRHGCILRSHSKYCNALEAGDNLLHQQMGGPPKKKIYDPASTAGTTRSGEPLVLPS